MKTITDINKKIEEGNAVVLTAKELCDIVRSGRSIGVDDVDVVTTATRGIMSGTLAILSFPVADPGVFSHAEHVYLNGVPAHAGPCPNEHLGIIDVIVHGTAQRDGRYGGGHLFHDLVEHKDIEVVVKSPEKEITTTIDIDRMPFARMITTRSAYRNYVAFVNPGEPLPTIFSVADFSGNCSGAVFAGCGEINPLEKDTGTIGIGTRILMNGAAGYVIGEGTRSTLNRRNLSVLSDMHEMDGSYISGFVTSAGPDVINSLAVPIPVLNEEILSGASRLDSEIELPIMDIRTRAEIGRTDYSQVWHHDLSVIYDPSGCSNCAKCSVVCPTGAFDGSEIDRDICCNCGHCVSTCTGRAFTAEMGTIPLHNRDIPIILRHSDRKRATRLADELKEMIENGSFLLTEPIRQLAES
ncbi:methanogenesis marker 16 metalloprotein [ANME-2 cluster archaeon]|nr:MAG: methanogenesis marker 16 metalloprotein [ANME-2 cluster archaeon]RLG20398.1 MAG: methanogenesis marker 16 metalloprotein [Methanosarcinales archaeon]